MEAAAVVIGKSGDSQGQLIPGLELAEKRFASGGRSVEAGGCPHGVDLSGFEKRGLMHLRQATCEGGEGFA